MTTDQRRDLMLRLEALMSEYAAASQRSEALAKVQELVARIPVVDEAVAEPSPSEPVIEPPAVEPVTELAIETVTLPATEPPAQ